MRGTWLMKEFLKWHRSAVAGISILFRAENMGKARGVSHSMGNASNKCAKKGNIYSGEVPSHRSILVS